MFLFFLWGFPVNDSCLFRLTVFYKLHIHRNPTFIWIWWSYNSWPMSVDICNFKHIIYSFHVNLMLTYSYSLVNDLYFSFSDFQQTKSTLVEKYVSLDLRISAIENMCPGPRLATAEAWVDHLQIRLKKLQESAPMPPQVNGTVQLHNNTGGSSTINVLSNSKSLPNGVHSKYESQSTDIARLALNLSVLEDIHKASSNEDFFAKLSQTSLDEMTIKFYEEIIDHAKDRAKGLLAAFTQLSELYVEQDGIIGKFPIKLYLMLNFCLARVFVKRFSILN